MARTQTIPDSTLVDRLAPVFRDQGFEGASLSGLASAAGLQKASLYHRYPGGKAQMAEEVMAAALAWYDSEIFVPLRGAGSPKERLAIVAERLDAFYAGGRKACLLNMLSAPHEVESPFRAGIAGAIDAIVAAFAGLAEETGASPAEARRRAERVVMLLQGSLVISRGLRSEKPFKSFLAMLPGEILGQGGQP
jgi:AcrR family transcriptional regulator